MSVKDSNTPVKRPKAPEISEKARYKDERPSPFSIEGIRSGAVASNVVKGFLVLSGLIMAGGFIVSSLNPAPGLQDRNGGRARADYGAPVAQVGAQTVTTGDLANSLARQEQFGRQYGQITTVGSYMAGRQGALEGLTGNAANIEAAKAAGIQVSDADVDAKINELVGKEFEPQPGQSAAAQRRLIESKYGSLEQAKAELIAQIKPEQRDAVRDGLYVDKLQKQVEDANKVTEDDYKRSVTKLKLYQIVVRPPLDPKNPKADPKIGEAAALAKANGIMAQLKANPTLANFQAVAKAQSEDAASKAKGGDIGTKLPAELGPDIGDAVAKSATPLVGPLKDSSGAQNIYFIESRKTELPKDYEKNKKKLLADFEKQQDGQAWSKRQEEIKKERAPQISDPALLAYKTQTDPAFFSLPPESQKKARAAAIEQYKQALNGAEGMEAAAINYQMAQLYAGQNDKPNQLAALKAAVAADGKDANVRLEYARALREAGQPKVALQELKDASKALDENPSPPSMFGMNPDDGTRGQLAAEFGLLKEPQLAAAERAKVKPAPAPGGMGGLPPGIQIQPQSGG